MGMAAIRAAPLEYILLETYGPAAFGGVAPEPRDAPNTLREVARHKILVSDVVSRQTTMNALALCGIGKHPSAEGLKG